MLLDRIIIILLILLVLSRGNHTGKKLQFWVDLVMATSVLSLSVYQLAVLWLHHG